MKSFIFSRKSQTEHASISAMDSQPILTTPAPIELTAIIPATPIATSLPTSPVPTVATLSLDPEPPLDNTSGNKEPILLPTPAKTSVVYRRFKTTSQLLQVYEELKEANALPARQKKLKKLMLEVINQFKSQPKTPEIVAEIVPLASCSDREVIQQTILTLTQAIKEQPIGNQALLEGLAAAIVNIKHTRISTKDLNSLRQGDIVVVADILFERLEETHNSSEAQRPFMYAISEILDAMLLANVTDLDRKKRESMYDSLVELSNNEDNEIAYYANIGIQVLARTPDDETKMHGALRRSYALMCGILTFSGMVIKIEFEGKKLTDVNEHFKEAFRLNPVKMKWYDDLTQIKNLLFTLKKTTLSLSFERTRLKKQIEQSGKEFTTQTTPEIETLNAQEKDELEKIILMIEMKLIEYERSIEPASIRNFIRGSIRALVETTRWSESAAVHEKATDYLKNILRMEFAFKREEFQQLVIHESILGLKTLVQSIHSCENLSMRALRKLTEIQTLAEINIASLFDPKRCKIIRESFITLFACEGIHYTSELTKDTPDLDRETDGRLLGEARQCGDFRIDLFIDRLYAQSEQYALEAELEKELNLHIPLHAKQSQESKETPWELLKYFQSFTKGDNRKILLLHGAAGAGKSLFLNSLEKSYWDNYAGFENTTQKTPVPLLIRLASQKDPINECMKQVLQDVGCQEADINLMRENVEFLFILDGYDEIRTTKDLFVTNHLSMWKGNVIITCRTEILNGNYRNWFDGNSSTRLSLANTEQKKSVLYEEAYIVPFDSTDIEQYIKNYSTFSDNLARHSQSKADFIPNFNPQQISYTKLKAMSGDLNTWMTNPFILSIAIPAFDRLEKRWQTRGGEAGRVINRAEVYEEFTSFWFEREENKLKHSKIMTPPNLSLKEIFCEYSKEFAIQLFLHNRTTVKSRDNQITKPMEKDPFAFLLQTLEEDLKVGLSRIGALVRPRDNGYSFIHTSLYEYFVAMSLWDALKKYEETNSLLQLSNWNQRSLKDEISIIHFLVDYIKNDMKGQELLFNALSLTKSDKPQDKLLGKLGGNVMTVLHAAQISFVEHYSKYPLAFTNITVEGAELSYGNFNGINFSRSSITQSRMFTVQLNNTDFAYCDLRDLDFGEFPGLQSDSEVTVIAYRPGSKQVATGHADGTVRVWDKVDEYQKPVVLYTRKGSITALAYCPTGKQLASASRHEKSIYLTNPNSNKNQVPIVLSGHERWISSLAYNSNGEQLASGSEDSTVCLWNPRSDASQVPVVLQGHEKGVTSLAFSRNGEQLASGSGDSTVCVWNPRGDASQVPIVLSGHKKGIISLAFAPNGTLLASGSEDKTIHLWDSQGGMSQVPTILSGHMGHVTSVVFAPSGKQLASGSRDTTIRLWNSQGGTSQEPIVLYGHRSRVTSLVFTQDGEELISGSNDKIMLRRWKSRRQIDSNRYYNIHRAGRLEADGCCLEGANIDPGNHLLLIQNGSIERKTSNQSTSAAIIKKGTSNLSYTKLSTPAADIQQQRNPLFSYLYMGMVAGLIDYMEDIASYAGVDEKNTEIVKKALRTNYSRGFFEPVLQPDFLPTPVVENLVLSSNPARIFPR